MNAREDRGFTLIELLIAITLSLMIGGVVVAALITSLNVSNSTSAQISDSTDAGFITSYLTRDTQSAGGIIPTTGGKDSTLGVSNANTTAGWAGCQQASPATLVVRFSWLERTSTLAQSKVVVTYGLDTSTSELTRRICRDSTTGPDVLLDRDIANAVATCNSTCGSTTTSVTLVVTGSGTAASLDYTLKASVRGDAASAPTAANSTPVPLLALGAGASVICPTVDLTGTGVVTVIGNTLVDSQCVGVPIKDDSGRLRPTGVTNTVDGIVDPFAARAKPSTTCPTTGTNPATIGVSASPTTIVKYPQPVNVTVDTLFQPGRFMFCQGLTFTSGNITGTDVLLYIYSGAFEVKADATVNLTGRSTTDKQMLVWSIQANQTIKIAAGPRVSSYRGLIYAPLARVQLSSMVGGNIGTINAQALTVTGAGQARLGLSIPVIAVTPATTLAAGQATVAYTNSSLVASGGTAPYTWSATGLPANLTMNAAGVISGTPTAAGTTSAIIVTVFDATQAAASFDYSMTTNAAPLVPNWPPLPDGKYGVSYPTTTMTATGGTSPYTWSVSSGILPTGLTLVGGIVSGTPTVAGTYPFVITVTDTMAVSATHSYTVTITGKKSYFDTVMGTSGLVSYWRLGEPAGSGSVASDTFTGSGTLQSHTGENSLTWTKVVGGSSQDAVLMSANGRLRKDGFNKLVLYTSSAAPASADYRVETDVYVASVLTNDSIGVVGRLDTATGTYYAAVFDSSQQKWALSKRNISGTQLWEARDDLHTGLLQQGKTYRLALDMSGQTIRLLVDGVERISYVDTTATATAGKAGVILGWPNQETTDTDAVGMQLDNFTVPSAPPAIVDSKGTNPGSYINGPTLGLSPGAIVGDTNTAVTFDGSNDYGTVVRPSQILDDFSIEFWFKSTQVFGSTCTSWTQGAGLVDATVAGTTNDFGVSLCAGKVVAGVGNPDVSVVSAAGFNNGAWHHVVFTRTKVGGVARLYIDGVSIGSVTGNTLSLNAAANINFGRLQSGSNYFAGSLDEVAVYSAVLDATTVTAHFNAAK